MALGPEIALLLALLIGVVAGMRSMLAPAAVTFMAQMNVLGLGGTWMAFLARPLTHYLFVGASLLELLADTQPWIPSRKTLLPFAGRLASGALSGSAVGSAAGMWPAGLVAGIAGATLGTLGGHTLRARLARAFGRDLPAALTEDAIALGLSVVVVLAGRN